MASDFLRKKAKEQAEKLEKEFGASAYGGTTWLDEQINGGTKWTELQKKDKQEDIAPVRDDSTSKERTWFKASELWDDGYQFGDVTKTILATGKDLAEDVTTGVIGIGEKVVDAFATVAPYIAQGQYYANGGGYIVDQNVTGAFNQQIDSAKKLSEDFVKKDLYDEEAVAKKLLSLSATQQALNAYDIDTEKVSVFGEKTDALAQSGGQLLGQLGVNAIAPGSGMALMGVTSFGSEAEAALGNGATLDEAAFSGVISAGAELLTEKIGGISFGGQTLNDAVFKNLSRRMTGTLADILIASGKITSGALAEGAEEILSGYMSAIGQKMSYMKDKEIAELFTKEDALESFIGGVVLGGMGEVGEAVGAKVQGKDYVSGLTDNEKAVVDKVYKDEVAKAEKNGKVSEKEKTKIYDKILKKMENGDISTDTIEEVLGGDTYADYKKTVEGEESALKELSELYEGDELQQQVNDFLNNSERLSKQEQLSKEVSELVKGDRLLESYRQRAYRGQKYEADLSQYDAKQQETVKRAIESGVLNNTRRTHELVDIIAKISADKGVLFDFTNNEKLKNSGFAVEGKTVNGFVVDDVITLNSQSSKYLNSVVGHEITHVLEGTEVYDALQETLFEYAKSRKSSDGKFDSEYKERLYNTRLLYKNVEGYQGLDGFNKIKKEVVADLVGDYLFTDSDFVRKLSTEHRNIFQKIYDEIKYLCKVATAGSKEARELEKVKKAFEDAYRAEGKAEGDKKYSLSDSDGKKLTKEQQEYFKDSKVRDENGNLKAVYHGSPADFNTFSLDYLGTNGTAEGYGFYFTDKKNIAEGYSKGYEGQQNGEPGKLFEVYLDIKKPLSDKEVTMTRSQFKKFLTTLNNQVDADGERLDVLSNYGDVEWEGMNKVLNYAMEIEYDGSDSDVNLVHSIINGCGDMKTVFNVLRETLGYDGIIVEEATWGGDQTIYVAFHPEQIKNVTNEKPTRDKDIRYSVSDAQNENGLDAKSEVSFSLSNDTAYMDKAIAMNNSSLRVDSNVMTETKALRERIADRMNAIKDRGLVGLPEDIEGNTYIANSSYDGTEENTTICPRSLASEAFVDAVSEYLGRPLTVEEQIYISQDLQGRSLTPECTYCYVATDRKAYRAFLGEYISQRDSVLQKVQENPNVDVSRSGELYKEFLNGRKDTNPMYSRFKMWVDAYKTGKPMVEASHLANINRLMGDINSEFGAELKPQIVDAMKYAQSASWAKKRVNYVAYNGHILKWKQDRINKLNSHYGLRMYSFSDFHPAFVLENMQMITDASVRGLKMLGYTKDTDFVDIFAPSGMNINVSTFGFEANGNVYENNLIGAEWEKAKALRGQYPNVGITFVATNDTLVEWALEQDWIDVVIPYHLVRTGAEVAKAFNYTNYTSESADTKTKEWTKGDKKYIAPTEHNNDKATYLAALEKNHLKPRFERFIDNPNYMKLVNECRQPASVSKPVQPVFNEDAAMTALAKLEANGYYQPIGGSVERMYEIAAEVAEDMTQELAPAMSLSNIGEQPRKYGNYHVSGDEVRYQESAPVAEKPVAKTTATTTATTEPVAISKKETTTEELFPDEVAPVEEELDTLIQLKDALESRMMDAVSAGDFDAADSMNVEWEDLRRKIEKLQQPYREQVESLSDADVPMEREAPYYGEPEKPTMPDNPFANRDENEVGSRKVKAYQYENPEVKPFFQQAAYGMMYDVDNSTHGEKLYNDQLYYESGGEKGWMGIKRHTTDDIADFKDQYGYTWDQIREAINDIIEDNGKENNAISKRIEFMLNDRLMYGYTDVDGRPIPPNQEYIDFLNEKQITEYSKEAFDSFMATADQYAPYQDETIPPRDIAPTADVRSVTEENNTPLYDVQNKKGVPDGQQAFMPDAGVPKKVTRSELHKNIVDGIRNTFASKGYDLDNVLKKAKNLSTFATVDNTPQRVMEKSLGYKEGQILSDLTVNQVAQNETEGIKWLNSFTNRKNGLLAQISKQYNIKPGSKESAAAQMYAEGFYVDENNDIIQYGDAELAKDFPDPNVRNNIKGLARDPRIRKIYDDTLAMINESRTRNAYPEIPRLDNYFLHFRAMEDTFSKLGLPFNPNDIRAKDLPTDLNGVTADLKPGQPYFASAMHRTGKRTSFDLLGGLERYLSSAKNQIYHIDDIQTLRALRNYIADTYGQANGLEGLDKLSEEEAQERIEKVYSAHLSTFAKFLNEEANILAGKTALIDRGLEGIIGRRGITFLDTVNKQVGSNMVGFNISSSLTNMLPVVQTFAKTNKFDFVKAFAQTTANKVSSIFGRNDGFAENSPVIIRRNGADRFYRTPWQKAGDVGYVFMGAVDSVSTELIARTKYNEFIRKGMDSQQAHFETDKWVSRVMGDRSLGQMPQIYNSKMLGLVTKFQLEVRNQLDSQFYDTIQEAKVSNEDIQNGLERNAKTAAKVTATFVQLAVAQHLFGKAFESVAGYNPAFDIIEVLIKAFGWDDDEEDEDTALDNIEEGFLTLLEDLPYTSTFTGGRIPISSALPVEEFIKGEDQYGNEKSRWETLGEIAPYYVLPGGYGQLKKTIQGLDMFSEDHPIAGSYTNSGKLRFPVEDTLGNRVQAGIFGQWASDNARDYFNNERKALNEKQTQEFIDLDVPIRDYWEYRDGLSGLNTLSEKADYIDGLDLTDEQKNILINNIADRKEDIDMSDYSDYDSFEEFDFASKNPDKYNFFKENGISYRDYESASDEGKQAYSWAFKNPEKYKVSQAISSDFLEYYKYKSELYDIRADKDENGDSIRGSAKDKKIDYINNLDLEYGQRIILFKTLYESDNTYNNDILDYLNGREDLSFDDRVTILKELGFNVDSKGNVTW